MPEYVQNRDIDRTKWDDCIARSCFETIYPYSWYLDLTARNWDGLISGQYDAVFPVTWNLKYGIHYVFQPLLTQQLGLFTTDVPGVQQTNEFIHAIPGRFKHVELCLNASNKCSSPDFKKSLRINYELDLSARYARLQSGYSTNTRRNIRKAEEHLLKIRRVDAGEYMSFRLNSDDKLKDKELASRLTNIFTNLVDNQKAQIWGAFNGDKLCSAVVWAFSQTRRIYINSFSDGEGKDLRAMFLLVDHFIRNNAEAPLILDFEGSMIPGIARFFEGFGASRNDYTRIRKSSFPLSLVLRG